MHVFQGSLQDLLEMLGAEDDDEGVASSFKETRSNTKFREWTLQHPGPFADVVRMIRAHLPDFQETKKALGHHYNTELDIICGSPNSSIWYDQTRTAGWITVGVDALVHLMPALTRENMFALGEGVFPIRGGRYQLHADDNYEAHVKHARNFVQWSLINERERTRDEILFYLYMLGRDDMTEVHQVLFAAGMTATFMDPEFVDPDGAINKKVEDAETMQAENTAKEAKLPDWQRRLFSPPGMGCKCSMCLLKRQANAQEFATHFTAKTGKADETMLREIGENMSARVLNVIVAGRAMSLPGIDPELRATMQGYVIREMGAPIFLSREEMADIVNDPERWNAFVNWGADELESKGLYNSFSRLLYSWCELDGDGLFDRMNSKMVNARGRISILKGKALALMANGAPTPDRKEKLRVMVDELESIIEENTEAFGSPDDVRRVIDMMRTIML